MGKSNLKANMKKATVELLLLKLLYEKDMYGYQLTQELRKRSDGSYTVLEGSMYPILYRLEDLHYISSSEQRVGRRQTRIYYHLEPEGQQYYQQLSNDFSHYLNLLCFLLNSREGDSYEGAEASEEILFHGLEDDAAGLS